MELSNKIKELRKQRNISQNELAKHLGVSFQAVSKWENGQTAPDLTLIPALAYFFKISIDELFEYSAYEREMRIEEICTKAAGYRESDPQRAKEQLEQIPEIYFTKLELKACLLEGKGAFESAVDQKYQSVSMALEMSEILVEAYIKNHEYGKTEKELSVIKSLLEVAEKDYYLSQMGNEKYYAEFYRFPYLKEHYEELRSRLAKDKP